MSRRVRPSKLRWEIPVALAVLALGPGAHASDAGGAAANEPTRDPILAALEGMDDPNIRDRWREALVLEEAGDYTASNARLEHIAQLLDGAADPYWRIARNDYHHSKTLPAADKDGQLRLLELAIEAAERGLALEPDCAQCMLWKYAALGRIPTLRGLLSAGRDAKTLASLLQKGIEASSRRDDPRSRATLAHFYYASSSFHRMVPDWFWLRWVFGVQGNKERAIDFARKAVTLDATKTEYRVELGAALLCLGEAKHRGRATQEGTEVLRGLERLPPAPASNRLDAKLAAVLLSAPEDACRFSRDGFIDVGAVAASGRR